MNRLPSILLLCVGLASAQMPTVSLGSDTFITGSITNGSATLTTDKSGIALGDVLRIPGITGLKTVAGVSGTQVTLSSPADATVTNASLFRVIGFVSHTSARVFWVASANNQYVSVKFGTSSGVYPYRTPASFLGTYGTRIGVMQLNGLAPATTYYLRTQTHPQPGNFTDSCEDDPCGSTEISFTTPADPPIHPEPPEPPATFSTAAPDTTGYALFPVPAFADNTRTGSIASGSTQLVVNSTAGMLPNHWIFIDGAPCSLQTPHYTGCQISSVNAGTNTVTLKSAVTAGATNAALTWSLYTVQDFTNPARSYSLGYGTIFEWAQGYKAKWIAIQESYGSMGFKFHGLAPDNNPACASQPCSIDDPNHRWIIFRTAAGPNHLPPSGVRTGPQWSSVIGGIIAQTPNVTGNGGEVVWGGDSSYVLRPHHFRMENLELSIDGGTSNFPSDATDPRPFASLVAFDGRVPIGTARHVVFDRLYVHGAPPPSRVVAGVSVGGEYMALINSYIDQIDYWQVYKTLSAPCSLSAGNTVLNIPQDSFQRNKWEPEWTMPGPATATLSATGDYSGAFMVYISPGGPHIEFTTPTTGTASIDCVNCTASAVASPATPYNRVRWCNGTISSGQFTFSDAGPYRGGLSLYATEGSNGITIGDGAGPYVISNNYSEAYGINFFIDSAGLQIPTPSDAIFSRNHLFWNQDHRHNSATSNGFKYYVRNLWEIKRGKRWVLDGNIFEGNFSNVNQGSSILLSGRPPATNYDQLTNTNWGGITDIRITNNIVRNGSAGFYCQGDMPVSPTRKVLFRNNLFHGIDNFTYNTGGAPGAIGDNIRILFGCNDVNIEHNTFGSNLGLAPYQLLSASQIWNEGIHFKDNIVYLNLGVSGGIIPEGSGSYTPWIPAFNGADYKISLDTTTLRLGTSVLPNYKFERNVIVGGVTGLSLATLTDITGAQMTGTYIPKYGSLGSLNFFPAGGTKSAREAVVQWAALANHNYRLLKTSAYKRGSGSTASDGADPGISQDEMDAAIGKVNSVRIYRIGGTQALLSYSAADGAACSVDYGTSPLWGSGSRLSSGGGKYRLVMLEGLTPQTVYHYRILCATEQKEGSFTTSSSSAQPVNVPVKLVPPAGVATAVIDYGATPSLGSSLSPAACSTGCTINVPGTASQALFYRVSYRNAAASVLSTGAIQATIP